MFYTLSPKCGHRPGDVRLLSRKPGKINNISNQTEWGWFGYTDKIKEFKEQVEIEIFIRNNVLQAQSFWCTGGCKPKQVKGDSSKKRYELNICKLQIFSDSGQTTQ